MNNKTYGLRTTVNTFNLFAAGVARFGPRLPSTVLPCSDASSFFSTSMATGFNRLGTSAYTSATAIVQQAKKDWKFYQVAIIAAENHTGTLLKEYKESGTWKEHYKTWTDACVPLSISRSQSNRLIAESVAISAESVKEIEMEDEKALLKLESSREEEPEKPQVKAALVFHKEKNEADQVPVACPKCHGSGWIGEQPKYRPEPCKCGCVLSVDVCQKLFEHGIPSIGLTVGQAGLLMGKLAANNWELPKAFEFARNKGEWIERKWRKK